MTAQEHQAKSKPIFSPSLRDKGDAGHAGLQKSASAVHTTLGFNFGQLPVQGARSIKNAIPINDPADPYELAADRTAEKIMRMPLPPDRSQGPKENSLVAGPVAYPGFTKETLRRKPTLSSPVPTVSPAVSQTLQGSGRPLDPSTRAFMEPRLGHDLSGVQIHNDALAHRSSKDIHAHAYTFGNHIAFAAGRYQPATPEGQKLLAHELIHVLQGRNIIHRQADEEESENAKQAVASLAEPEAKVDPEDEEIVAQFAAVNKRLGKANLKKWIRQSIAKGWSPGAPVPDYRKPDISFNEKQEPVIESPDFRGTDGAFNTASKLLPKNVGAKFWWKERFTDKHGQFKLDYASNKAYTNLLLHEKAKDVDLDLIQKVADDIEDYNEIKGIKAYSDRLLSEAFVRFVAKAQSKLYPQNLEKQTGILDAQTASDIVTKISADKQAVEKKAAEAAQTAAKEEESRKEEVAKPVVQMGPIHDTIRAKIAQLRRDIGDQIPLMVKAADMATDSVIFPGPHLPMQFLYRISQHFILGFLLHLDSLPEEEIKKKFMHLLTVQYTPGYLWGQLKGVPQGIWSWIKDMAEMIWELIKLPYTITKFALVTLPGAMKSLFDKAAGGAEWLLSNQPLVMKFVTDLASGSGADFEHLKDDLKNKVYELAEGGGQSVASSLSEFAGKSDEAIGNAIGRLEGYLLPDIILAVFSEGIGNAIKEGMQSIKIFIEAGRAGAVTLKALEAGKSGVQAIEKFLASAKIFAKEGYGKIKTLLKDIIEYVKKLLGIEEEGLAEAKAAGNLLEDSKALSKLEGEAGEAAKKDAQKYAEHEMEEGPEKKSKTKMLWKAIIIAEVADVQNLPITAAIAELDLLKTINPKVRFVYSGNDPYEIEMIGCRHIVNPYYTVKGGSFKRARTLQSGKPNELATAGGRSGAEMGGMEDMIPENIRSLKGERPAADAFAKAGYKTEFTEGRISDAERQAEGIRATANPDLRVEGHLVDIYNPAPGATADIAVRGAFDKVINEAGAQTRRVAVIVDDARISRGDFEKAVRSSLKLYGQRGIQEIFVIQKGKLYPIYPF